MPNLKKESESTLSRLENAKPKAISLMNAQPVKTGYLKKESSFPLVISPSMDEVDLIDWAEGNKDFIETQLLKHGAILFRGFDISDLSQLEKFAEACCHQLFDEYGDLPREGLGGKVYGSTPYPSNQAILFHNEGSHLSRWPLRIWFYCVKAPESRGETPLVDCRQLYQRIGPAIIRRFTEKRLVYVRSFIDGLDVRWQEFFQTDDRSDVEEYCRKAGIDFSWIAENGLKIKHHSQAIATHPITGEKLFFNQIQLHHSSCLEPAVRESLLALYGEEDMPRNVFYGDGSRIEDSTMHEINKAYREIAVEFAWQERDILMLDNMLVAHGRNPYMGQRKIVVAMGQMIDGKLI